MKERIETTGPNGMHVRNQANEPNESNEKMKCVDDFGIHVLGNICYNDHAYYHHYYHSCYYYHYNSTVLSIITIIVITMSIYMERLTEQ